MLTVRVGCNIHFECESAATVILLVNPRFDADRPIRHEKLDFGRATKSETFADAEALAFLYEGHDAPRDQPGDLHHAEASEG